MLVEICSSSIESVIMANKVNADRIELCSNMNIGGLTPSMGLIELALKVYHILKDHILGQHLGLI